MSERTALVIGHGDEPALLAQNLRHHLGLGIDAIVVSTIGEDRDARAVVRDLGAANVSYRVAGDDGEDAFLYFEAAARTLIASHAPDWIGFIDTDEFIVTRTGRFLSEHARAYDLRALRRFNAIPQRSIDGTIVAPDLGDPSSTILAAGEIPIEKPWLAGDTRIPYVAGADLGAKIVVRPYALQGIGSGGHAVHTRVAFLPRVVDPHAVIVHVPFSTPDRFRTKVIAIRDLLERFSDRFYPWQWIHWSRMDDGELADEFERQVYGSTGASSGATTTAARFFAANSDDDAATLADLTIVARTAAYLGGPPLASNNATFREALATVFDRASYVQRYADLARAAADDPSFDPFEHFLTYGIVEGRRPSYAFDPHRILVDVRRGSDAALEVRDAWWLYLALPQNRRSVPNDWFDAAWFQSRYGPSSSPYLAFRRYLAGVARESWSPNGWFDELAYRRARPDVARSIAAGELAGGFQHFWIGAAG